MQPARRSLALLVAHGALWALAGPAAAQVDDARYRAAPAAGLELPTTPLAGDFDARAAIANPGGLQLLDGDSLVVAAVGSRRDDAVTGGDGVGGYAATVLGGGLVPRFALGAGLEYLSPARAALVPDPGTPWRLTLATSFAPRPGWGLGVAWHRLAGDGAAAGASTFDVGATTRFGNHLAVGVVARDLNAPTVGAVAIRRSLAGEVLVRPLGTDRLALALGARAAAPAGDRTVDLDGWLRAGATVATGLSVEAVAESRALTRVDLTGTGAERDVAERDVRLTVGLTVSFGQLAATVTGGARLSDAGLGQPGGAVIASWSERPRPSVLGAGPRLERIELTGALSARTVVATALRLRAIARDRDVRGVILALDGVGAGWASLEELRAEIARVRASGKKVFAYLVTATSRDYWLASAADKIYLDPAGGIRLIGFAGTTLYLRGLFTRVGVEPQFEKIAEWKSAPEQFTETGPSDAAATMRDELYDDLWATFVDGIATSRRLEPDAVRALVDGGPYTAGDLVDDRRLVDAVGPPERIVELIAEELGGLAPVGVAPRVKDDRWVRPAIAVIYADGDIVDGESRTIPGLGRKLVGGETVARAIAAARAAPEVVAIVLRIDSPGGSALASELMAREVFATRGVKPIVCSLGDVAASGGYFLAAGCDTILAARSTVTGSIGIFYGKFDLSGLLSKLGVTTDTFRRGARADMESLFRPFTEEERAVVRDRLGYFYGRFKDHVARGRDLTEAQVEAVARGRVWSGAQAKARGLVDQHGGVTDAVALAKARAGLDADDRVRIVELPRLSPGLLGLVGRFLGVEAAPSSGIWELPAVRAALDAVPPALLVAPGAQARLPFDLIWE
ncbi:MAG: signal peptide peptidase SppA [Kofleriaceae bacterium]|jgi:protease-4|nr:signal peptide peptidase SppA [Kofleriaceae bacterium]MBP9167049.1 signal peptide peptidase SppA [Kofleriaceae bacterium]MBP9860237.1 signal peptide peptidase SppA [Kofleriaceae bacterium]